MSAAEPTILIVEDDPMVRGWIRLALEGSEFVIGGEASSAAEALELVARRRPELLLVDFRLPDRTGTELVRELRQHGSVIPALLMTANTERGFNELARDAGAQGTVLKTGRVEELLTALRSALVGKRSFDRRHPAREAGGAALSRREREVLALVAGGATNRDVAEALGVSDETVKTLLTRIFAKLGVRRRAEAVSTAHRLGLL